MAGGGCSPAKEVSMTRLIAITLMLALAACATGGPVVQQEQAAQFQQAAGYPYNSFYCP